MYLDLNGFKPVNDAFGHAAGDAALLHICGILLRHIRESDILGRLGGDEFGLLLPKADFETAKRKALGLAEQVQQAPFEWQGTILPVTFSHGVTVIQSGQSASDAIAAADKAMYQEKKRRPAAAE
jgi:diguanylate cyclase (GGDEF)-like protein